MQRDVIVRIDNLEHRVDTRIGKQDGVVLFPCHSPRSICQAPFRPRVEAAQSLALDRSDAGECREVVSGLCVDREDTGIHIEQDPSGPGTAHPRCRQCSGGPFTLDVVRREQDRLHIGRNVGKQCTV